MKRNDAKKNGKVYPFRHNAKGVFLCILTLILCAVGAGLSVYRIIRDGIHGFTDALQSPFLIAVCLFCAAVIVSVMIKSEYIVTESELITRFGFIKSSLPLSKVTSMEHDRTTHKLTVCCGEEYTVFTLKEEWADDIAREICKANPNIEFSFTMTENKPPKDENGKREPKNGKDDKTE